MNDSVEQSDTALAKRELDALKAQINPHVDPVFSGLHDSTNKMKLGLFCANASSGSNGSLSAEHKRELQFGWEWSLRLHQVADAIGFEFTVPVARWLGYSGSNGHGGAFETLTWAAGLAASTKQITVLSTVHVAFVHPVLAAKAAATIDRISRGRYGINAVMGWFEREAQLWNHDVRDHDDRYEYGGEWVDLVTRLWTEDEPFDYHGKYLDALGAESNPKPCRRPLLINAGISEAGVNFCAQYCDYNYGMPLPGEEAALVQRLKARARDVYHRDIGSLVNGVVIMGDTEADVTLKHEHYMAGRKRFAGSMTGGKTLADDILSGGSQSFPADSIHKRASTNSFGIQLIGTPEQITEKLVYLSEAGVDGISLNFQNVAEDLCEWDEKVMPLMRSAGLRE